MLFIKTTITAAIAAIVVFSVVVVPFSVLVVIDRNVCPIDTEELAERYLLGKLMDGTDEHVFCDKFEVSNRPLEYPPRGRTLEATLSSDTLVVEFASIGRDRRRRCRSSE